MIAWRPHPVEVEDVATIVLGGWLAGSAVFGVGFALVASAMALVDGEPGVLMMLPPLLFLALFGAGLLSLMWVLPIGLLLVPVLRLVGVGPRLGFIVCVAIGCGYAFGWSHLPGDWQWWGDFWYAAPIYGAAMGMIYARIPNA